MSLFDSSFVEFVTLCKVQSDESKLLNVNVVQKSYFVQLAVFNASQLNLNVPNALLLFSR